jgi:hypothetical protein
MCDLKLMPQQPFLAPFATAITNQRTVAADHAVTGNNDGDIVLSIGACGRADHFGIAKAFGKIHVADRSAVSYFHQLAPYPQFEIRYRAGEQGYRNFFLCHENIQSAVRCIDA